MVKKHCFQFRKVEYQLKRGAPDKEISILLPAYNEAAQIEQCVLQVEAAVRSFSKSYEIIVSEDGSTDGTDTPRGKTGKTQPQPHSAPFTHSPRKRKSHQKRRLASKGKIITFMDVDLATNLECLPQLLQVVKTNGGMAIGSRHIGGSTCSTPRFPNPV